MAELNEKELLANDYVRVVNELAQQTTQVGGGFFQLSQQTDFEDRYPNAIDEYVKNNEVKDIADKAGVIPEDLKPPFDISDETILSITNILESADPLTMSDEELAVLRSDVDEIVNGIDIPTAEQLTTFVETFTKFVAAADSEDISFPTNFREIPLVSTDTSLDAFLSRTGVRGLVAIKINKLVYPFITERHRAPSNLQATLIGASGTEDDTIINYTGINKEISALAVYIGSTVLITNQARDILNLKQQKTVIDWISEDSQTIRVKTPLLFELDDTYVVKIYQYTEDTVLSPGDFIKIPK